jgi:membrane protease YdiL (CAAX protease family)
LFACRCAWRAKTPVFRFDLVGKLYALLPGMTAWIARHPLRSFYVLSYVCSWSIAVPLALQARGLTSTHLPLSLHYLMACGPAMAAMVVTRACRTNEALPHVPSIPEDRARTILWCVVGFASPLMLFEVTRIAARLAGHDPLSWSSLGAVSFLPDLGLSAWAMWFVTNGIGEELGWRGFALPRLQRTHSALASSALLTLAWAGWHLPAFFYVPGYAAMGFAIVPGFFIGLSAGAVVLTWLFNNSGASVLPAMLWHASFNFVTASPNASGPVAAVISAAVMVWAAAILWRYSPQTFTTRRRPVRADTWEQTKVSPRGL